MVESQLLRGWSDFSGKIGNFSRVDVTQYFTPLAVLIVDRTRELNRSVLQFDDLWRDLGL